jgi:hypothetical protein
MRALIFIGLVLVAVPAAAQTTCQTFGGQTHCTGPNGSTSDSRTFGNQTRIQENGPNGQQRVTTCRTFGTQTRCD